MFKVSNAKKLKCRGAKNFREPYQQMMSEACTNYPYRGWKNIHTGITYCNRKTGSGGWKEIIYQTIFVLYCFLVSIRV
jgi:hypothetical protein